MARPTEALGRLRGLSAQLLLLTVLPLTVLLIAVAFAGINLHQRDMRDLVGERDRRAVAVTAAALNEQIADRFTRLRALADRAAECGNGSPACQQRALATSDYLTADLDGGVALYDASGGRLAASQPAEAWLAALPPANWLAAVRTAGKPVILLPSPPAPPLPKLREKGMGGEGLIPIAAPSSDGRVIALGAFSAEALRSSLAPTGAGAQGRATLFLTDGQGGLLAAFGPAPAPTGSDLASHPGVAEALRGESGVSYVAIEGEEKVVAFAPVPLAGWALVLEEAWGDVVSPQMRLSQAAPLVLLPAVLVALVALAFGWSRVVHPLQALRERAARLGRDDWASIEQPVGGIEEIAELQHTLVNMARQVRTAREALEGYIADITAAQEEERRRLARELHDETIQSLVALNQRVQMARRALAHDPARADEKLAELHNLLTGAVAEVRRFSQALRPIYLEDLGLLPALEMLARDSALGDQSGAGPLKVTFETSGAPRRLPPAHELALYRIVQEALNNVSRHAQARTARVLVAFDAEGLTVQVSDDGEGFAMPAQVSDLAARGHFGLMGMRERAQLIGAHLSIRSQSGQGTTVEVRLNDQPRQIAGYEGDMTGKNR